MACRHPASSSYVTRDGRVVCAPCERPEVVFLPNAAGYAAALRWVLSHERPDSPLLAPVEL